MGPQEFRSRLGQAANANRDVGEDKLLNSPRCDVDQKDLIPVDKLEALADCISKLLAQGIITGITAEQIRTA